MIRNGMLVRRLAAALVCLVALPAVAGSDAVRVATYNVQGIGAEGSRQYRALVEVLQRVDADVVLLQEVNGKDGDLARLDGLAVAVGYDHRCVSRVSGTLSGHLHNACLSRRPIQACRSWSAAELSGDPRANDITRDVLEVQLRVAAGEVHWGMFVTHLKGGREARNRFRRQVELRRVLEAIRRFREGHPTSPVVLAGDLNDDAEKGRFGTLVFSRLPTGLPRTYRLGTDVAFPVVHDPFTRLAAAELRPVSASHEDTPKTLETRWVSHRRIDYLLIGPGLEVVGTEVYDSCDDNGRDDPPPGHFLPKAGAPLPCRRTGHASDHFPVFADLRLRTNP
jgi:endonuclease/exonuclease/phosphatase family metal-dependent hydrolase